LPKGQPLVGLLKVEVAVVGVLLQGQCFLEDFGIRWRHITDVFRDQDPAHVVPFLIPVILNMANRFGVSDANDVTGSSSGPVFITTLTFTSPTS